MEQFCYISFLCFAIYIVFNVSFMFFETFWVYGRVLKIVYERVLNFIGLGA